MQENFVDWSRNKIPNGKHRRRTEAQEKSERIRAFPAVTFHARGQKIFRKVHQIGMNKRAAHEFIRGKISKKNQETV